MLRGCRTSDKISQPNRAGRRVEGEQGLEMGRVFTVELDGRIYRCHFCRTHLALAEDIVSKGFHSRHGKAYLFNNVANISTGDQEERVMQSGIHTVADIFCCYCGQNVGWKYEAVCDKNQKYKEGKFVLERTKIDGLDTEFHINTHPSGSDVDDN